MSTGQESKDAGGIGFLHKSCTECYGCRVTKGSVRRLDGGWGYRVDAGPDPETGRRRQVSKQGFATKREAQAELNAILSQIECGIVTQRSSASLGDYLDEWLPTQKQHVRSTTLHSYAMAVDRIKRHLSHVKLQALTPLQIERFYSKLLADGGSKGRSLAAKTVRNTHVVLRKALADAERLELVSRNAAATAKAPRPSRPSRSTWSSEDIKDFFAAAEDNRLFAAFVLLATTGMRRGEVLGARWSDVNLDAGQLYVANTLTTVGWGQLVVGPPKTPKSRRIVYLDTHTLEVLKNHRQRQREERVSAGDDWDGSNDLAFRDEFGGPLHPDWFSREFDRIIRISGMPRIRLHDLRHSYATVALSRGIHPKVVSERLGHATVGITLDLYSHVAPGIAKDAAEDVASTMFT
jgi:integrase